MEDKLASLPAQPGVYLMKDRAGTVLYVGKAISLRSRVRSYFQAGADQPIKTQVLVSKVADLDYLITATEKEALILESNLIKKHKPRYNVNLKDDKHFLYLKFTIKEDYPRLIFVRRVEKDNSLYFGPYASANAVRETIQIIHRLFPIRKCSQRIFKNRIRPCINFQLKRCLAPCCYKVDQEEYNKIVKKVLLFLRGQDRDLITQLIAEMNEESKNLNFERAALIRDEIKAIEKTLEKQKIVSTRFIDQDVISYFRKGILFEIFILFIRQGRMVGNQSFSFRKVELEDEEVISSFLTQFYGEGKYIPDEVIIPLRLENQNLIEEYFSERKGKKIKIIFPHQGDRKNLLTMAFDNAKLMLENREAQSEKINRAMKKIKESLRLQREPRIIECFDISNLFGKEAVGSMVRFEEGEPLKQKYRHYKIKTVDQADDYGMMYEVIKRRLTRGPEEQDLPDLLIVDGGKGQLQVAGQVMKELGITIDTIGLAKGKLQDFTKGPEKVFLPGRKDPLILSKHSSALHLLQRIRDEAHRFAITFHRKLRAKKQTASPLDSIPGIGPKKKKNLLIYFGSIKKIQHAEKEEISQAPSITAKDAENIYNFFHKV
ncbi:MAG: excinuclease ABC subunit UvrC [Thermodesulfobacteriota bacterium]|nr:MAG: excinuclease ABC subunit UvrC [Thermodesulfobacteriota bacterium]